MNFVVMRRKIKVFYSTLLHLPPLTIHCVGVCWDRTRDCCNFGILEVRRSYILIDLIPSYLTSIWLFMWSYVCQWNSPRTQTPALLILPQFGCLHMWSHVCQSNSPQTQTPAMLILPLLGCLCGPTSASGTPRRRRPRQCWYYLYLAVYVVPCLPVELPADADPGIVDITSV